MALDSSASTSPPVGGEPSDARRIVSTEQLFGGDQEVALDHGGTMYRLRITRQGKLILTK